VRRVPHRTPEDQMLRCHYCGAQRKLIPACPSCGATDLWFGGVGIQKIEREVARLSRGPIAQLTSTPPARARRPPFSGRSATENRLLLGTQMVTKGFISRGHARRNHSRGPSAPPSRLPRRRAHVSDLTQVAGRAGRGESPGEVIMQSYDPSTRRPPRRRPGLRGVLPPRGGGAARARASAARASREIEIRGRFGSA
jgi:primosomal protein N' (replication factor Y)